MEKFKNYQRLAALKRLNATLLGNLEKNIFADCVTLLPEFILPEFIHKYRVQTFQGCPEFEKIQSGSF